MVNVTGYSIKEGKDSKPIIFLELMADPEFVQSMTTGRFYLTARKCNMVCTLPEQYAKTLVGKQLPGSVTRVEVEPYEYTVPGTGEVIMLNHSYQFVPNKAEVEEKQPMRPASVEF